jgi:hypothetical protein
MGLGSERAGYFIAQHGNQSVESGRCSVFGVAVSVSNLRAIGIDMEVSAQTLL